MPTNPSVYAQLFRNQKGRTSVDPREIDVTEYKQICEFWSSMSNVEKVFGNAAFNAKEAKNTRSFIHQDIKSSCKGPSMFKQITLQSTDVVCARDPESGDLMCGVVTNKGGIPIGNDIAIQFDDLFRRPKNNL